MGEIRTVEELYPRIWLRAEDLGGKRFTLKIVGAEVREFRQPDGQRVPKLVLTFERATRKLIVNKTQCKALAALIGSPAFADWPGHLVGLAPGVAPNGRPTITVLEAGNGQKPAE
jgi:hypothetical protein